MMKPDPIRSARILLAPFLALALAACNTVPAPRPIATWAPTIIASPTPTPGTPEPTSTATPAPTATASPTPLPTPTPIPTATPVPLPSARGETGWTTIPGPGQAFSITLPASWQPAFVDPKTVQTMITALTAARPELVTLLTLMLSGGAFAAVDPSAPAGSGIPTGVMVLKQPKGMIRTADMLAPLLVSAAQLADGIKKPVERRKVRLSAGEAEEIVLRMDAPAAGAGAPVEIVQTIYPLDDEDDLYLVIFTTPAGLAGAYAPTFHKIAESFTFASR